MEIHNRLREFRARHDLTQAELAKRVGVVRQTIIALEKGEYLPSLELAFALADACHVPVEEIFPRSTRQ